MSPARKRCDTMPERYDQALAYGHEKNLPAGALRPNPTSFWSVKNVALLEQYAGWLSGGGASTDVIRKNLFEEMLSP
jgi:hypothetical protein